MLVDGKQKVAHQLALFVHQHLFISPLVFVSPEIAWKPPISSFKFQTVRSLKEFSSMEQYVKDFQRIHAGEDVRPVTSCKFLRNSVEI